MKPLNARNVLGVCLKSAHENWLSLPAPYTDAGVLSDIECDLEHALKAVRQLQQGINANLSADSACTYP